MSESGEKILLRTKEHDYEFSLPENRLTEAPLPSEADQPTPWLLTGSSQNTSFGQLRVDPDGAAKANFTVRYGGYDPRASNTETILSTEVRDHLAELEFSPSNGNVTGDISPALYMVWNRDLIGRQYPALSQNSYTGRVMANWCCFASDRIQVAEDNPAKLTRHRKINSILAPFHAIGGAVRDILSIPVLLLLLISGFRPGG